MAVHILAYLFNDYQILGFEVLMDVEAIQL